MIIVTAKLTVKKEALKDALVVLNELVQRTKPEAGCIEYNAYRATENEAELIFIEKWESQSHLDAHCETPHFKELFPKLVALAEVGPEVKTYTGL